MVDTAVQVAGKEKEQQLQAGLNTDMCMSCDKDQKISMLEKELQESQKSKWKCITKLAITIKLILVL